MPENNPFVQAEKNRVNALRELSKAISQDPEFSGWSAEETMAQIGNILNYPEDRKAAIFEQMATRPGVFGSDDPRVIRAKLKELWTPIRVNEDLSRVKKYLPEGFDFSAYLPTGFAEIEGDTAKAEYDKLYQKWWADFQQDIANPSTFGTDMTMGDIRKPENKRNSKLSTKADPKYWFANRMMVATPAYENWDPIAIINDLTAVVTTKDRAKREFQLSELQKEVPDIFGHMTLPQIEAVLRENLGLNTVAPLTPEEQKANVMKGGNLTRVLLDQGRSTRTVPFIYPQKKQVTMPRPSTAPQQSSNPTNPPIRRGLTQ